MTEVLHGFGVAERERVAALRTQQRFFWLDVSLQDSSHGELGAALAIPAGALQALADSGRTSRSRTFHAEAGCILFALRCYVGHASGDRAAYSLRPIQVHVVLTAEYLLTLHEERLSLPEALAPDLPPDRDRSYVVYAVLDAMVASTFDALEEVEVKFDALADVLTDTQGRVPRAPMREGAARLTTMRRWITVELAVFERLDVEIAAMGGFEAGARYFDLLDEQVNRLVGSIDAAGSAAATLLDLQLNERAYLVSVIATIFVPLTFLTGFFGMNFGWMVEHVDSPLAFWLLGFLLPLTSAIVLWRAVARLVAGGQARARR